MDATQLISTSSNPTFTTDHASWSDSELERMAAFVSTQVSELLAECASAHERLRSAKLLLSWTAEMTAKAVLLRDIQAELARRSDARQ